VKNEVWNLDELEALSQGGERTAAAKAKAIRNIVLIIIEFLNQIESFQKMLFEKKKFVLRTDYCITLDLVPPEFYDEIGNNVKQIAEWKELFQLDIITKDTFLNTNSKKTFSTEFLKQYKYMMLDTKNFSDDFKYRLLQKIEDIDEIFKGVVIKSENLQYLNMLQSKYNKKIKSIYIDPPYNTKNLDFNYKDNYQHSTWLSMMVDRLFLGNVLLGKNGLFFVSIDENEKNKLDIICEKIFYNKLGEIIVHRKRGRDNSARDISKSHDYLLVYAKDAPSQLSRLQISEEAKTAYRNPDSDPRGKYRVLGLWARGSQGGSKFDYTLKDGYHFEERLWLVSKETMKQYEEDNRLIRVGDNLYRKLFLNEHEGTVSDSIWADVSNNANAADEIKDVFGEIVFDTTKPYPLMKRIIELSDLENDIILDFFAGSGSTAIAVLKTNAEYEQNNKYILIESESYFEEVLLKRILKNVFSFEWNNGLPLNNKGVTHAFKYQYIEQYEDTLNNIEFKSVDGVVQKALDRFPDYFLSYILDFETQNSPTRLSIEKFKTPFNYRIKTLSAGEEREEPVDLVETFNYLLGLQVKKLRIHRDEDRLYRTVFGERDHEQVAVIWRDTAGLDLERDKRFIEETILAGSTPDTIFVNGDSYVKNAKPIEPEFRRLMGA
jgi:adenine-specific DNA-methyltransferase